MANPAQHRDFGEKIGDARKDLCQQRGFLSTDLSEMNSREANKYVKKDNIWKKWRWAYGRGNLYTLRL